jgi:hypothetical protein
LNSNVNISREVRGLESKLKKMKNKNTGMHAKSNSNDNLPRIW